MDSPAGFLEEEEEEALGKGGEEVARGFTLRLETRTEHSSSFSEKGLPEVRWCRAGRSSGWFESSTVWSRARVAAPSFSD